MKRLVAAALLSLVLILLLPCASPALADAIGGVPDPRNPDTPAVLRAGLVFAVVVSGLSAALLMRLLRPHRSPSPPEAVSQASDGRGPGSGAAAP